MNVLHWALRKLAPSVGRWKPETIRDRLTALGHETTVDELPHNETRYNLTITPNRGDMHSVLGVARELEAWRTRHRPRQPIVLDDTLLIDALPDVTALDIRFEHAADVLQFHGVLIDLGSVTKSPAWLARYLESIGQRPIHAVVDLTNYLAEQYGQPLHAFDYDALLGHKLELRRSRSGERLTTLDGVEHVLPDDLLVAADASALTDLVGIMGGQNSEVTSRTRRVFLQSAMFAPTLVRRASVALRHRTPSSQRYERGVDPLISRPVLNEAIRLLVRKEFGSAHIVGKQLVRSYQPVSQPIPLKPDRVNALLGSQLSAATMHATLRALGCEVQNYRATLRVSPPSWRYDLTLWQDLAEEIGRFVGLNDSLPVRPLPKRPPVISRSQWEWTEGLKDRLVDLGLSEVQTYSFIGRDDLTMLELPNVGELANAVNPTLRYLRPSLMPGLVHVVARNPSIDPITVFEIGHVFTRTHEDVHLGVVFANAQQLVTTWLIRFADSIGLDSDMLHGTLERLTLSPDQRAFYKIRKSHVTLFEIPLSGLATARRIPSRFILPGPIREPYRPLSKFPPVARDLALIVDESIPAFQIESIIRTETSLIEGVQLFDEFRSDRFGLSKKSLAFHIRYAASDRTLTDDEVAKLHDQLTHVLEQRFHAVRR